MLAGRDSAFPPSPSTISAEVAGGIRVGGGYISTAPYDGYSHFQLYHPWPKEGFDYLRALGGKPIAFCSGWDNPNLLKILAQQWDVRLCLDVENGIRGDGPWVEGFLIPFS